MKSSKEYRSQPRFQLLSKEAQKTLSKYEYLVICFMVVIAAASILWSVSIYVLAGDFHHGIFGAKLVFHPRDFSELDMKSKEILTNDLENLLNRTYNQAALNAEHNGNSNDMLTTSEHVHPEESTEAQVTVKLPKIAHLFQTNAQHDDGAANDPDDVEEDEDDTTQLPEMKFNLTHDRLFLSIMTIDVHQTRWRQSITVQFIYSFPFLSEILSIIWTAMCLIFQSGVKKYWGLPKPWRIVVPSITIFTLMSLCTGAYTYLANRCLANFCRDLRAQLSNPNAISCGQAISVLRPAVLQHRLSHDVYLVLFRFSYTLTLIMWLLALIVMTLRFIFAIDFQLVDITLSTSEARNFEDIRRRHKENEFSEVLLNSPQRQTPKSLPMDGERQKSEDDFQSAKSQQSEVAAPLLDDRQQQQQPHQQQQHQGLHTVT